MKRRKLSRSKSRKLFKKTANRYHKKNKIGRTIPRGGVCL